MRKGLTNLRLEFRHGELILGCAPEQVNAGTDPLKGPGLDAGVS
jgi:hypothetical protein